MPSDSGPAPAPWVTPANTVLTAATPLLRTLGSFDRQQAAARRQSGLPARADDEFLAGMRELNSHLQSAPELTPIGRIALQMEVTRRLANRLRVLHLLERRPELARRPVDRPIFVTGLPRTGTSLLHGMLAQHSGARAALLWELLHPAATPAQACRKVLSARMLAQLYYAMVPAMRTIHPLSATEPEECVFAVPHSGVYLTRVPAPGYQDWYARHDFGPDYAYLKMQLQVLQAGGDARRWVLKSPFHLGHLDALLRAFPDATIIITERDPAAALASWCSFSEATRRMHNRRVDPHELGRTWLAYWQDAARRATASGAAIVTCDFDAVAADPAGTAELLWSRLGADVTADDRAAFAACASRDRRRRPGGHRYTLQRYGLEPAQVRSAFAGTSVVATPVDW